MTFLDPQGRPASIHAGIARSLGKLLSVAAFSSSLWLCGTAAAQLQTVAFDDFEDLHSTMVPFTIPLNIRADGTDYSNQIRTGTPREWTIDNSDMGNPPGSVFCLEPGYNGWTAMDVGSWTAEQGRQIGRTSLGLDSRNTALVADPDAFDDFKSADQTGDFYNSYISRNYDLTEFDTSTLQITFDWEFAIEDNQRGTVEVSFDDGETWQLLLDLFKGTLPNGRILLGPSTFIAGQAGDPEADFVPSGNQMLFRIGCLTAGNNWWFAVDNVRVTTGDGFDDLEDFEGLEMVPFDYDVVNYGGTRDIRLGRFDGTDFTNVIPNWNIDNSQMPGFSREPGFDGWNCMDVHCWSNEQGGQGRQFWAWNFGAFDANAALIADGDAFYDYDRNFADNGRAPSNSMNTYIQREYDLSGYDNRTLKISMDFQFRVENQQRGTVEVSFDGGTTWVMLQELTTPLDGDGNFINNGYIERSASEQPYVAGTDFAARQSNTMILRLGYLDAGNNWWFAVDNIRIEAETIDYVKGDANGDSVLNNFDLAALRLALLNRPAFNNLYPTVDPDVVLDFNLDGVFNNLDLAGFRNVLLGN